MIEATDVMRSFITNLKLPLKVYRVEDLGGGKQTLYVENTQYLNTKMYFELDGFTRRVDSFIFNSEVTITGGASVAVGTYYLDPPYFIHGKYTAVNNELSQLIDHNAWNPLVWMLELTTRNNVADVDSRFESVGDVRLFIMSTSDWGNYTTADHYAEVIKPMGNIVKAIREQYRRNLKVSQVDNFTRTNHAKFTTGSEGVTGQGGAKKVLPDYQSGIELIMSLPIVKCTC